MFLLQIIAYTLAILGTFLLALFVLINNPRSTVNRVFALLSLSIVMWLTALLIADTANSDAFALLFTRIGSFVANLMPVSFVAFCYTFAANKKHSILKILGLASLPVVPFLIFGFSNLMIEKVAATSAGVEILEFGFLYSLQAVVIVASASFGFLTLIRYARKAERQVKNQINFIIVGFFIAILANVFSGFIAVIGGFNVIVAPVGVLSLLAMSCFMAYSIIRHRLFDIRFVVARSVAYILLFGTFITAYSIFVLGISRIFFSSTQLTTLQQAANVLFAILLAVTFHPLKLFFDRITNKIFYRDAYDSQLVLDKIGDIVVRETRLKTLLHDVLKPLQTALRMQFGRFILIDGLGDISHTALIGSSKADLTSLIDILASIKESVIVTDNLRTQQAALQEAARRADVAIVVRLETSNSLIGYLILGSKQSGNIYNNQDIGLLNVAANEIAVAIENSLRFEEIQAFNETLQTRIEEATKELRASNKKLHELDIAKDEFISMASHQLRTPLTTVKGYLSIVLEGDVGDVTPKQRKVLEQAYAGSLRMAYLIGDFLNVSRIQTGKFVLEPTKVDLAKVVADEVNQLQDTAKSRQLRLTYQQPDDFPIIQLDENKIRQVIMNFIDNAIFYSKPKDTITIELLATEKEITLKVRDHGIGVPVNERHHLFTKFYRASNARKVRPDGTGIGLFMAKKVVVAHGGSIIFETTEGKGSIFGFRLPRPR